MTSLRDAAFVVSAVVLLLCVAGCSSSSGSDDDAAGPNDNGATSVPQVHGGGFATAAQAIEVGHTALITLDAETLAGAVHPSVRDRVDHALALSELSTQNIANFEIGELLRGSDDDSNYVAPVTYFDATGEVIGRSSIGAYAGDGDDEDRWYYDIPHFGTADIKSAIARRFEELAEAHQRHDASTIAEYVRREQRNWAATLDLAAQPLLHDDDGGHGMTVEITFPYPGRAELLVDWHDAAGEPVAQQRVPFVFEESDWYAELHALDADSNATHPGGETNGGFETAEEALQVGHHALFLQDAQMLAAAVHPSEHERMAPAIALMDDIIERADSISMTSVQMLETDPPRAGSDVTYFDTNADEIATIRLGARVHNGRWFFLPPVQ